ncbi:outer membrane beta-barrel protein [Hymenobacter swuensis]|uniref:Outer membrane protein beta-barrel domain-containing protein n=1 Tax=Hymenobacter swuensis DY53 TaxID=1227739 RepID=W8F1H1_9BACT|nr:outer membrane beta-barrel protein [Hymenobacter swuensis]AHJ99249.1 hypothetical protein Hsw_3654 [Hymenobacter swuensis DY53]
MAASAPNTPDSPTPRPTGDLEHLFQQKFAEAEVTPRASLWDQLDHELVIQQHEQVVQENTTYRRRLVVHRWVAAACLLLALGFGSWAFLGNSGLNSSPELAAALPGSNASAENGAGFRLGEGAAIGATVASGASSGGAAAAGGLASVTENGMGSQQVPEGATAPAGQRSGLGQMLAGLYESVTGGRSGYDAGQLSDEGRGSRQYAAGAATLFASHSPAAENAFFAGFSLMEPRAAYLRNNLGLRRPDTLKPALLAVPQAPAQMQELAAVEPEQKETPKLWKRLRLGGSLAAGSFSPNINFSHTDGRVKADPVTTALRSYYQDEAEDEYRRNLRAGLSQCVALTASYALNKHWTLTGGAEVAEQRATSATTYGFIDGKQVGREAADIFSRPAAYNAAPAQPRTTSYHYRTAAVPVGVRYGSNKAGLSLYAKVGAAVSVLLSSRSELDGSPEATRAYSAKSTDSPYRQVLTSLRGGAGVRYQPATASWSLAVGPAAETYLTTLNANPSQRVANQSRPYSLGVEASVEFGTPKPMPGVQ